MTGESTAQRLLLFRIELCLRGLRGELTDPTASLVKPV
jgi:hypothetical protein